MKTITFILADDHPLILAGNKAFLTDNGYKIIGTADNGNDAFNMISKKQSDFAILDLDMPVLSGIEVAEVCKSKKITTKIIILSLHKSQEIIDVVGKTVEGYVLKEDAISELLVCIQTISSNKCYVSSTILNTELFNYKNEKIKDLTVSEVKILRLIAKNMTSNEIADNLFISKRTVEKHRSNIVKKLQLDSNSHSLIVWAQKNKALFV